MVPSAARVLSPLELVKLDENAAINFIKKNKKGLGRRGAENT